MPLLALAFVTVMLGQSPGPYTGDWTADFQGTTYIRLTLNDKAGAPQGAMSIGKSIKVDGQGNIDRVAEAPSTLKPMIDVRRIGNVLSFSYEDGSDDVSKFELRLIDANTAELTLILPEDERKQFAAEGVSLPKPFRLAKSR